MTTPDPTVGLKQDDGKDRWDLLPLDVMGVVVKVLTFGARKYSPDNWRLVSDARARYTAALLRHLAAYRQGEWADPETSLPHLGHLLCCGIFLLGIELAERRSPEKAGG